MLQPDSSWMCFALSKTNICKTAEGFEVTMRIVLINNCHSIPVALNVLALKNKRASFFFFLLLAQWVYSRIAEEFQFSTSKLVTQPLAGPENGGQGLAFREKGGSWKRLFSLDSHWLGCCWARKKSFFILLGCVK